jgi:hypothetical protein
MFPTMNEALLNDLIAAVEQQLTSPDTPYVAETFARLTALGMDAHEAKTQIAICLGEEMDEILRERRPFDPAAYRKSLAELPMIEEPPAGPQAEEPDL